MHRMHRYAVTTGLALVAITLLTATSARAALIRPDAARSYPDIAADINGVQTYVYNPSSGTGTFQVNNTPYLIAGGPTTALQYDIMPDAAGVRSQSVTVKLDSTGNIVKDPGNSYELWGSVTANGKTFDGLLLKGVPTAFGSQDLSPAGITGAEYDLALKVTGGALAGYYGTDAYMRISPELESTFHGSFTQNFSGVKALSNTRSYASPYPFPVPEPTTLVLLVAFGGAGLLYRHRRPARRDLGR